MPIPFLLGALVAGAAAIGVGGHIMAASDNSKAKSLLADAQYMYDNAKKSLEQARESAANALFSLGKGKKKVLDTSMSQFLRSYEHVKPISMRLTTGINELDVFAVDEQAELHIREMTNIYDNAFKGAAAGAATGAIVTLGAMGAAGVAGAAGIAGSGLATAGGLLIAGEVGAAATAAGSALTAGAVLTPLAAVAAPVVMFTGISAAINADENLDKAKATYAEAETAVERMRVAETICHGIEERSQMFQNLMNELNAMFAECTGRMEPLVEKKRSGFLFFKKQIKSEDLSPDEIQLLAVTRSLAGAIKAVLDTPIMTREGSVDDNSSVVYDNTVQALPVLHQQVEYVRNVDFSVNPVEAKKNSDSSSGLGTIFKAAVLLLLIGAGWYLWPVFGAKQTPQNPSNSATLGQQGITSDWALSGIAIGDTNFHVFQKLGEPIKQETKDSDTIYYYPTVEVHCPNGHVVAIVSNSPEAQTAKGIHEGSPIEEVLSVYGENYTKFQYNDEEIYEYEIQTDSGNSCLLRFAMLNGVVDYISIRME